MRHPLTLYISVTIFPGRPRIVLAVKTCRWHVLGKKKAPTFRLGLMFALPIFLGRPSIVLAKHQSGGLVSPEYFIKCKNRIQADAVSFMFALPIFPGSHPPSIVGAHELNFCVRDGNRWTLMTINTNSFRWLFTILYNQSLSAVIFGDPYRIRTDVNGVRGRCLNHLTNGPLVHLQGLEPGTH